VVKAVAVPQSAFLVMNVTIQAVVGMETQSVIMILPVVVAVVGAPGVAGKEAVVLYRDVILGIVILMGVKVNLNVRMILLAVNVVVGAMELVVRPEVVL